MGTALSAAPAADAAGRAMSNWISSTAVFVRNAKRASKWYCTALDWKVWDSDEHWVVVGDRRKGSHLHLCQRDTKLRPQDVGESGILIVTDDFDNVRKRLQRAKVKWATPPRAEPWGFVARFSDPDGNVLWLSTAA